jgi:excisionase family DNA binding protein
MTHITVERHIGTVQAQYTARRAYSIAETCALTGLGRDTVYTAIRDGRLAARKLGRRTLITDDDLRQFLAGLPRACRSQAGERGRRATGESGPRNER